MTGWGRFRVNLNGEFHWTEDCLDTVLVTLPSEEVSLSPSLPWEWAFAISLYPLLRILSCTLANWKMSGTPWAFPHTSVSGWNSYDWSDIMSAMPSLHCTSSAYLPIHLSIHHPVMCLSIYSFIHPFMNPPITFWAFIHRLIHSSFIPSIHHPCIFISNGPTVHSSLSYSPFNHQSSIYSFIPQPTIY